MSKIFIREIDKLKKQLVCLFRLVEKNYALAMQALDEGGLDIVRQVYKGEQKIDEKRIDIQEECYKIVALHQPVAFDLRFIMATWKFNNDLERIADLAVGIADRCESLAALPPCACPFDIDEMAGRIHGMLNRSLDALINLDIDLAARVMRQEPEINAMHQQNLALVKQRIRQSPEEVDALLHFLSVSRYLERIGDLINNLGQEVIYIVEGEIVQPQDQSDEPVG